MFQNIIKSVASNGIFELNNVSPTVKLTELAIATVMISMLKFFQ